MAKSISYLESVKQMPLVALPVRAVVVQLESARVLLSPGSTLTPEELRSAGEITDIVATSLLHSAGCKRAKEAFPKARLWGPLGIREKRDRLTWDGILGVDAWPFEPDLACLPIDGMPKIREHVFLDRASSTLIVADLAFNLLDAKGVGAWLIFSLFGTYQRFAVSKFFLRAVQDRAAFERSLKALFAHDFDSLAPSHGDVIQGGAKEKLRAALAERGFVV